MCVGWDHSHRNREIGIEGTVSRSGNADHVPETRGHFDPRLVKISRKDRILLTPKLCDYRWDMGYIGDPFQFVQNPIKSNRVDL